MIEENRNEIRGAIEETQDTIRGKIDNFFLNGLSAYELAVKNGYQGTVSEWLSSLKGEKGEKGEKGDSSEIDLSKFYTKEAVDEKIRTKADAGDSYTKTESDERYQPKGNYLTQHQDLSQYAKKSESYTKSESDNKYQPKGNYLTEHQSLLDYAKKTDIPSLTDYAKKTDIPTKLPNPNSLTINGYTYDGSQSVNIDVEGGESGNSFITEFTMDYGDLNKLLNLESGVYYATDPFTVLVDGSYKSIVGIFTVDRGMYNDTFNIINNGYVLYDGTIKNNNVDFRLMAEPIEIGYFLQVPINWETYEPTHGNEGQVLKTWGDEYGGFLEWVDLPAKLPNPQPLTINGQEYDGSEKVDITVEGGDSDTLEIVGSEDEEGNPISKYTIAELAKGVDDGKTFSVYGMKLTPSAYTSGEFYKFESVETFGIVEITVNYDKTISFDVKPFYDDTEIRTQIRTKADKSEIPTKLANPNPLIINGQTYDGTEEVNVTVEGSGESIQSNWVEDDINSPSYIQNKPFGWFTYTINDYDSINTNSFRLSTIVRGHLYEDNHYDIYVSFRYREPSRIEVYFGETVSFGETEFEGKFKINSEFISSPIGTFLEICVTYIGAEEWCVFTSLNCNVNEIVRIEKKFLPPMVDIEEYQTFVSEQNNTLQAIEQIFLESGVVSMNEETGELESINNINDIIDAKLGVIENGSY